MTASANISETALAGKYSRLFVSNSSGTMFPANASKWKADIKTTDIPTTGFEDFGYANGLCGVIEADLEFEMPFQLLRSGAGALGNAAALLYATARFVFEGWLVHPDFSALFGSIERVTCVAQVIGQPVETEVNGKASLHVTAKSRGAIYLPNSAAPSPSALLQLHLNTPG